MSDTAFWPCWPYDPLVEIVRATADDIGRIVGARKLFDHAPTAEHTRRFLEREGHHLLLAVEGDEVAGFVSGVETTHPDKGTEMFLYELSVGEKHRRQRIGTALVEALAEVARKRGCYGMWVGTEPENAAALATYRAAGAEPPEPCVTLAWSF